VQSPYFKNYLLKQKVSENKIIYYPYYAENFYKIVKPKKEIKSLFRDTLNIVFAGNIGVAQSFDTIIDAAIILKKTLSNFTFIIIGDGRDKKRVVSRINKLSLSDNFIFLGSYPPTYMSDFFACADALLVSLKDTEIFSLTIPGKLQSYLACGKPIIASLNGIGSKIIVESKSGLVSKSEDSRGLADSIIKFSNLNDSEREQYGLNARDYFEKEFERIRLLNRLIDIFEK
jgi:glycosyltransferase involved in cell wall biosynthesis